MQHETQDDSRGAHARCRAEDGYAGALNVSRSGRGPLRPVLGILPPPPRPPPRRAASTCICGVTVCAIVMWLAHQHLHASHQAQRCCAIAQPACGHSTAPPKPLHSGGGSYKLERTLALAACMQAAPVPFRQPEPPPDAHRYVNKAWSPSSSLTDRSLAHPPTVAFTSEPPCPVLRG